MLLRASMDQFRAANGILLFMYSVLLSRVCDDPGPRDVMTSYSVLFKT
jgi:hypothetical protein